eukprot:GHVU01183430.1.p1 GENE.GHVU01183430.1~~GHVU01183430.1.p1  ORF type:complete len:341 (-),score=15.66 GHVU01183430.1:2122-3144(-)
MQAPRSRLRPLHIPRNKHVSFDSPPAALAGGSLSPDLGPNTPPTFPPRDQGPKVLQIGAYLLLDRVDTNSTVPCHEAYHTQSQHKYLCKVVPLDKYRDLLSAYWRVDAHEHICSIEEIILGETKAYVFFQKGHGDLHSYVRTKRKLRESEAIELFRQIVKAVIHCHDNGLVLRDLKLRKFVFKNPEKTQLKLEGLEDACLLEGDSDELRDKHGCPAYVSPEILNTKESYSGRAADCWSIGVMLYTMLIGRYPFHDNEPTLLFNKIRTGQYSIPDVVSSRAKCLIRSLLRMEASERLSAEEILQHPWFRMGPRVPSSKQEHRDCDQAVPEYVPQYEEEFFV